MIVSVELRMISLFFDFEQSGERHRRASKSFTTNEAYHHYSWFKKQSTVRMMVSMQALVLIESQDCG